MTPDANPAALLARRAATAASTLRSGPKDEKHREETFLSGSEAGAEQLYELMTAVRDEVCNDGDIPYNCRNKEIVQRLYVRGAFTRKSAVKAVSDFLGISRNTIYLHIRNAEKSD